MNMMRTPIGCANETWLSAFTGSLFLLLSASVKLTWCNNTINEKLVTWWLVPHLRLTPNRISGCGNILIYWQEDMIWYTDVKQTLSTFTLCLECDWICSLLLLRCCSNPLTVCQTRDKWSIVPPLIIPASLPIYKKTVLPLMLLWYRLRWRRDLKTPFLRH